MKKAIITCVCNKAGAACDTCAQYAKIQPDKTYRHDAWSWRGKVFKTIEREN